MNRTEVDRETITAGQCVACIALLVLGAIVAAVVYRLTSWPWLATATLVLALLTLPFLLRTLVHVIRAGRAMRRP